MRSRPAYVIHPQATRCLPLSGIAGQRDVAGQRIRHVGGETSFERRGESSLAPESTGMIHPVRASAHAERFDRCRARSPACRGLALPRSEPCPTGLSPAGSCRSRRSADPARSRRRMDHPGAQGGRARQNLRHAGHHAGAPTVRRLPHGIRASHTWEERRRASCSASGNASQIGAGVQPRAISPAAGAWQPTCGPAWAADGATRSSCCGSSSSRRAGWTTGSLARKAKARAISQ